MTAFINNRAELLRYIDQLTRSGCIGETILLQALAAGQIAHWQLLPETGVSQFNRYADHTAYRPTVVSIPGDDDAGHGPSHWPAAKRAIKWSTCAILHGAAAEPLHYQLAIEFAQVVRRILIIETPSTLIDAWLAEFDAVGRKPNLLIRPRSGPHPLPRQAGEVH